MSIEKNRQGEYVKEQKSEAGCEFQHDETSQQEMTGIQSEVKPESNADEAEEKKSGKGRSFKLKMLYGTRIFAVILLSICLFVGVSAIITFIDLGEYLHEYQSNMRIVLENVEYGYEAEKMPGKIIHTFQGQEYVAMTEMASVVFEKKGLYTSLRDNVKWRIGCKQIYVINNKEYNKSLSGLTESEWQSLKETRMIQRRHDILTYGSLPEADIVIKWQLPDETENRDLFRFAGEGQELQIVDRKSGLVISSNLEEQCDQKYENLYGKSISEISFTELEGEEEIGEWCDDGQTVSGIKEDPKGTLYFYLEHTSDHDDLMLANHVPLRQILRDVSHIMFPQLLLMLLVYVIVIIYAIRLFSARSIHEKNTEGRKIFKKVWVDSRFLGYIGAFMMVGVFVVLFLTLYLQALINYSTQNIRANRNLVQASKFVEQTMNDKEAIEKYYSDICTDTLTRIAYMIELEPSCADTAHLEELTNALAAKDITIYDADGVCTASSGNYAGYRLSDDQEYECREFLAGTDDARVLREADNESWWILAKRKEAPGMLIMRMGSEWLDSMTCNLTVGAALACTTFDQADLFFVQLNQPEKVHRIKRNSFEVETLDITLDEKLLSGKFTGQARIDGINYYVNELRTDQVLYISALREGSNWLRIVWALACEIGGFLLLFGIQVLFFAISGNQHIKKAENKNARLSEALLMEKLTDSGFRKMLSTMLKLTVVILFVVLFFEIRFFSNAVIRYLFGSQWEKKLNLFSITVIMFYAIAARIICIILTRVIMLVARNMGQRSITIGHMICSMIRFGALMAWSVNTLVELGIELRYLLTGAGIAGVVIGYACQGVINDLLTGLFLVFEGNFQVGDWVRVDDWRGEVLMIGVRTTKIGFGGDVRVFNNSCLKTITVLSHSMCGALCYVSIAYAEDVERVLDIINRHSEQYQIVCPHIVEGPGVHGVTELGDNGVTIRMWALVDDQEYAAAAERAILKETKRLFDENGITIPFPQVVVHADEEDE